MFWRSREKTGVDVEHGPAKEVSEDNALPVGIYFKSAGSEDSEIVEDGHPFPTRISDAGDLADILLNPVRFASRVSVTCAAAENYAAADVMSNSATDGAGRATFVDNLAREPGGIFVLQTIKAYCSEDAVLAALRLFFFRDMPKAADTEMDDNIAFDAAKTQAGRQNLMGDGVALNALADRGTAVAASTTTDIHDVFQCAPGSTGAWIVVTTDIAETNETAGMTLDFEFYTL